MQDRLNYLASHDFVTRLHNRQALDAQVSERRARLQLEAGPPPAQRTGERPGADADRHRPVPPGQQRLRAVSFTTLLRQFADLLAGLVGREDFWPGSAPTSSRCWPRTTAAMPAPG